MKETIGYFILFLLILGALAGAYRLFVETPGRRIRRQMRRDKLHYRALFVKRSKRH
ncbi:MAG: hypothetical protein ACK4NZ_07645 [Tsuneonella sp.]